MIVFNSFLVLYLLVFISNVFCTLVVNLDEMFIVYYYFLLVCFFSFHYLLSYLMMNNVAYITSDNALISCEPRNAGATCQIFC